MSLKKIGVGFASLALAGMAMASTASAAAVDYASTTTAIDEATSGLLPVLLSGSMKVVGIALGIWGLFFIIGKLRKHTK